LLDFTGFISAAMSQTAHRCLFSLFQDFFAGAASLMLQQQLSEFLTFFTYAA
jgi:hypothetical protein